MSSETKPRNPIFCPVCGTGRETPKLEPHRLWLIGISGMVSLSVGLLVALVGGAYAGIWGAALSGLLCFLSLEVYYSLKFRRELACPVCHFDPALYQRLPEEAKRRCLEGLKTHDEIFRAKWQALKREAT